MKIKEKISLSLALLILSSPCLAQFPKYCPSVEDINRASIRTNNGLRVITVPPVGELILSVKRPPPYVGFAAATISDIAGVQCIYFKNNVSDESEENIAMTYVRETFPLGGGLVKARPYSNNPLSMWRVNGYNAACKSRSTTACLFTLGL